MAEDEAVLSMLRHMPNDVRLAERAPEGLAGETDTRDRRFAGGRAGTMGDSQKNDPRPGDPVKDAAPEKAGDWVMDDLRDGIAGESMSIPKTLSLEVVSLGDRSAGSV
jgi:hypothetical protein